MNKTTRRNLRQRRETSEDEWDCYYFIFTMTIFWSGTLTIFWENSTREQGVLERSLGSKCALNEATTHCMYGYWNGCRWTFVAYIKNSHEYI
jgi:hypothetical protein